MLNVYSFYLSKRKGLFCVADVEFGNRTVASPLDWFSGEFHTVFGQKSQLLWTHDLNIYFFDTFPA